MNDSQNYILKTYDTEQTIFSEGELAKAVYILKKGMVEIRTGITSDRPKTVATLKKGDVFGELALIEARRHNATAITVGTCEVVVVPRDGFLRQLLELEPVMRAVVVQLVERLRKTTEELDEAKSPIHVKVK